LPVPSKREATRSRNAGVMRRRCRWLAFGQGSGKLMYSSLTLPGSQRACRASRASPCTIRAFCRPLFLIRRDARRNDGAEISTPRTLHSGRRSPRSARKCPPPKPSSMISGASRPKICAHGAGQGSRVLCSMLDQPDHPWDFIANSRLKPAAPDDATEKCRGWLSPSRGFSIVP